MHTAIIEFDPLADAVRTAAEHDDLFLLFRRGLALFFIGGVHVGRGRGKLGGTGIHALVYRTHLGRMAPPARLLFRHSHQLRQTAIGKPLALPGAPGIGRGLFPAVFRDRLFGTDQIRDLRQKPGVDVTQIMNFLLAHAGTEGVGHMPDTFRARHAQRRGQPFAHLVLVLRRV
jgi:hypothetical protein